MTANPLEQLAQAVLDGRVRVYASGHTYDSQVQVTYDIVVEAPTSPISERVEDNR